MPQSAFIVRPFGRKPYFYPAKSAPTVDKLLDAQERLNLPRERCIVTRPEAATSGEVEINFDLIEQTLIQPALVAARLHGETTGAVVEAGNIREDMFNRLITADMVIADVSMPNPNVYYELGLRQAFRDKFTFVIRCDLSPYPFDLQTDRYFAYDLLELIRRPEQLRQLLTTALRKTLNQYRADSPVFKLMPQLEAEDRSRFLAVPEDFREEVERAHRQRQREYLDLLALECEKHLWEIEGLRVVGRAQFEANFIEGAKETWQRIAVRYPDDAEANTVLSTVYQRQSDRTRSEQALARVTRSRTLSPQRASELRALSGRNHKAAWSAQWKKTENPRHRALSSPLLQRAIDAYLDAFKLDLNNSYAGLNALTLMVIQAELIDGQRDEWRALQRNADDENRAYEERARRIDQLAHALLLALESDRERLTNRGQGDPWFAMLEAAVMCTISKQPEFVAQLYVEARYYAPPKSDAGMISALEMYQELGIRGSFKNWRKPEMLGTLGDNVAAALKALQSDAGKLDGPVQPKRLLVFVGLRADDVTRAPVPGESKAERAYEGPRAPSEPVFPAAIENQVRELIEAEVLRELEHESKDRVLAIAGGASGGDLLFHEVCKSHGLAAQMFLALPKPQHIGTYVSPSGSNWVTRFNAIYRHLSAAAEAKPTDRCESGVKVFSESADLPRWLQGLENYNVGRRSMLWMLQHAHNLAHAFGSDVEPTLIALHQARTEDGKRGFGGIQEAIRLAQMHGVNVRTIVLPRVHRNSADQSAAGDARSDAREGAPKSSSKEAADSALRRAKTRTRDLETTPIAPSGVNGVVAETPIATGAEAGAEATAGESSAASRDANGTPKAMTS